MGDNHTRLQQQYMFHKIKNMCFIKRKIHHVMFTESWAVSNHKNTLKPAGRSISLHWLVGLNLLFIQVYRFTNRDQESRAVLSDFGFYIMHGERVGGAFWERIAAPTLFCGGSVRKDIKLVNMCLYLICTGSLRHASIIRYVINESIQY